MSRDYGFVPYKTYYMVPEPSLTAMALDHLFQISSINHPSSYNARGSIMPLPTHSRTCVSAETGRLSINFGSVAIQGWAISALADIEAIVDEGRRNFVQDPEIAPSTVRIYDELEREAIIFLDHVTGTMALNARDVIESSLQALSGLCLSK